MNLDFLRSQFAEVSKRHPGLSLIKLLANKDDSHPRITTVEKRGAFPSLHGKFAHREEFPLWTLSGAVDCDFWALWLDRDTVYSREENKRCLHEYSTVFSLTSELVKELTRKPDCPSWIREQRDLGFYSDGTPYFGAGQWLSLVSNRLTDTTAMYFPLGSSSTAIVVRDIGLESILFLDSITNGEQVAEADSKPKKSRQQPDHPITEWYREHGHKYDKKTEAVKAYADLHGGDQEKLYSDLHNQRNRLTPKKTS